MLNEDCTGSFDNDNYSCIVISDGVSTCARSRKGAEIAVETVLRLFRDCGDILFGLTNAQIGKTTCDEIVYELKTLSHSEGTAIEDYSATVAFAVFQKKTNQLVLFSLGDSTIVTCSKQKINISSKPEKQSSATYTTTTKDGYTTAYISRQSITDSSKIYLLTDGAWSTTEAVYSKEFKNTNLDSLLCAAIEQSNNYDDSSFISMSLDQ